MTMATLRPYDIQPGESATAYEAFAVYRDIGAGRSVAKAGNLLGKATTTLDRWVTRFNWAERAHAFDEDAARRATTKSLDDHAAVRARQARHARLFQLRGAQRIRKVGKEDDDKLTPAEAIQAFKVGAQEERAALGIQNGKTITDAEGNVLYKVYEGTSPDDL